MGKRYKEFLVDAIIKTYQIILAVMVVTPIAMRRYDLYIIVPGLIIVFMLLIWAGAISAKLEV